MRGTGAAILDTRKTTPGLRALEKQAVAAGGGRNHRMGLDDAILIKENHVALAGGSGAAVELRRGGASRARGRGRVPRPRRRSRRRSPPGPTRLLLDNMDPDRLREAVALRDAAGGRAPSSRRRAASRSNVAEVAATGVDTISIGALTHSAPALDLSMLLEPS